jgi:hypothetical protein
MYNPINQLSKMLNLKFLSRYFLSFNKLVLGRLHFILFLLFLTGHIADRNNKAGALWVLWILVSPEGVQYCITATLVISCLSAPASVSEGWVSVQLFAGAVILFIVFLPLIHRLAESLLFEGV